MKKSIIDFLTARYGDRLEFPQPLVDTHNEAIQAELEMVDKRIVRAKRVGLLWLFIGASWTILSIISLTTEVMDAINIFKVGLGIVYFVSGLVLFSQVSELKRKKVILETMLFVNEC